MAVALLFVPVQALTVRPARGSGLLWAAPAGSGTEFRLSWTHTVTRRLVTETYRVGTDHKIHLLELTFDQFGPNLPSEPEPGTTWRVQQDRIVATGYTRVLNQLNLGVGPLGHRLAVSGREWDMVAGAGPDRFVRVAAERIPWIFLKATEVWQWRTATSQS